jgi:hypothetical protein
MAKHGRQGTPPEAQATEGDLLADAQQADKEDQAKAREDAALEARREAASAAIKDDRKRTGLNYQDKYAVVNLLTRGIPWEEAKRLGAPSVQDAALEGHKDELLAKAKVIVDQRQMNEALAQKNEQAAKVMKAQAEHARAGPMRSGLDRGEQRKIGAFLKDGRPWEQAVQLGLSGRVDPKVLDAWRPTLVAAAALWTDEVPWDIALKQATAKA